MARPRGSAAIKLIDAQGAVEIRNLLHAGGERLRDQLANLFLRWRGLIALRDDCAKRLKSGAGTKWTRERCEGLEREIAEDWRALGAELGAMSDEQLSDKLAVLSQEMRPLGFRWQEAATRLAGLAVLTDKSTPGSKTVDLKGKTLPLTFRQFREQMPAEGFDVDERQLRRFACDTLGVRFRRSHGEQSSRTNTIVSAPRSSRSLGDDDERKRSWAKREHVQRAQRAANLIEETKRKAGIRTDAERKAGKASPYGRRGPPLGQ